MTRRSQLCCEIGFFAFSTEHKQNAPAAGEMDRFAASESGCIHQGGDSRLNTTRRRRQVVEEHLSIWRSQRHLPDGIFAKLLGWIRIERSVNRWRGTAKRRHDEHDTGGLWFSTAYAIAKSIYYRWSAWQITRALVANIIDEESNIAPQAGAQRGQVIA